MSLLGGGARGFRVFNWCILLSIIYHLIISPAFNHSEVGASYDSMDGGIQPTGRVRVLRRLRFRSRSLVLEHRAHIAVSQSMLHENLIRLDVPIWLVYTISSN